MPELETRTAERSPVPPLTPEPPRAGGLPLWVKGLGPLVLLAALVFALPPLGPVGVFRQAFPPVEELTLERIRLPAARRDGSQRGERRPEPVTIAQVMVDDANWVHTVDGSRTVGRLESRTVTIPYPWVEGEPHTVTLVTSTGLTFSTEVAVATRLPPVDARYLGTFALLGVYAGVIPVFIGLLWLPFVRAIERRWMDFFLSLTIGLLVFLGVDAFVEALETAALVPGAFQGTALVVLGLLGTPLVIGGARRSGARGRGQPLAALRGGAHRLRHRAPQSGRGARDRHLVRHRGDRARHLPGDRLPAAQHHRGPRHRRAARRTSGPGSARCSCSAPWPGVPTVLGAWIGGFTYSPIWTTLFFAIGAGAIVQVVYELWRLFARRAPGGLPRRSTRPGCWSAC